MKSHEIAFTDSFLRVIADNLYTLIYIVDVFREYIQSTYRVYKEYIYSNHIETFDLKPFCKGNVWFGNFW